MRGTRRSAQVIGEFLEWIQEQEELSLCDKNHDHHYANAGRWVPTGLTIERLLAKYFDIDMEKIGKEKDEMLAEMRRTTEEAS